jgi:predicted Zn-ribbon and HTH transcriptional regulator
MYKIQNIIKLAHAKGIHNLSYQQEKVIHAISKCKTDKMGGHTSTCEDCGHETIHYNSCRNRHCPCCQTLVKEKWIDKTSASLIEAPYFHVVFTVPHELNPIFMCNQKIMYNLFYSLTAETLKELALDPKYKLEANIGFISVLHTWGSNLTYHPHIHIILLAGGLNNKNEFVQNNSNFLFPFPVMAKLFKYKFLHHLDKLWTKDKLEFKPMSDLEFIKLKTKLYKMKWVPYAKKTFMNAKFVIEYLGRYTHRIAISNSRITNYDQDQVSFKYKDYKTNTTKVMTLTIQEFVRRFLMHVLPERFVKIRYYGILSNRSKEKALTLIRTLIDSPKQVPKLLDMTTEEIIFELFDTDITKCPKCQSKKLTTVNLRKAKRE